jgi:hypothetical protein
LIERWFGPLSVLLEKIPDATCSPPPPRAQCRKLEVGALSDMKWLPLRNAAHLADYRCHYCGRPDGAATRDHKVPRSCGGAGRGAENIVLCCKMCNMIKSARDYQLFVLLFGEFLEEHGEEYRAADPDERKSISVMSRKFNGWLHALQSGAWDVREPPR